MSTKTKTVSTTTDDDTTKSKLSFYKSDIPPNDPYVNVVFANSDSLTAALSTFTTWSSLSGAQKTQINNFLQALWAEAHTKANYL